MSQMPGADTTSPSLIGRLADWQDHGSWTAFVHKYEPPVREYCRRFPLDPSTTEELVQQVWVEVARRLRTFTYDPAQSFRGWLILVCRSRAIDLIRKQKLDSRFSSKLIDMAVLESSGDGVAREAEQPPFLKLVASIQETVRQRIDERTWIAFWRIVVEEHSVRETADSLGMTYAAAFAAQKRVRRMLREEGEKRRRQVSERSGRNASHVCRETGMNGTASDCPTTEMLRSLGSDWLPQEVFDTIETHIQSCLRCLECLERLSAEEPDQDDDVPSIPGFTIEKSLGRGGMGIVYQAWQAELARRVAIKVLTRGPANRRRWLREARSMARIRHPNTLRLHQLGECSGRFYLVLDLIPGGSLRDRMPGPIPARRAASLVETVARAASHIHESGMLHLDIKPSNILLDGPPNGSIDEMVPVLADFGLARALDDEPGEHSLSTGAMSAPGGTPAYMAPEQLDGRRDLQGPQTDVFALGCTLYALLTGLSPFQGASVVETIDRVRTHEPVPPRRLVTELSRDLETIVLRCLRKEIHRALCVRNRAGRRPTVLARWVTCEGSPDGADGAIPTLVLAAASDRRTSGSAPGNGYDLAPLLDHPLAQRRDRT